MSTLVEPAVPQRIGTGRTLIRGWRVFVPIVVVEAAIQALLVLSDPVPALTWGFSGLVIASLGALLLGIWLSAGTASAAASGQPITWRTAVATLKRPAVLAWSIGIGAVATGASLLELWLTPLVLLLGAYLLPLAANAEGPVWKNAHRPFVTATLRSLLYALAAVLLAAAMWIVALVFGFFITGSLGAALTWLCFGVAGIVALCASASLHHRP